MPADPAAPDRVSTLELFFDLVFVFTITQVSSVIVHEPTAAGLARAALELTVIAWMYGGYAWLTNAVSSELWHRRLLLLLGMAGFFVCALAVPRGFGEDGVVFGLGYLFVNLVHLSGFLIGAGRTPLKAIYRLAPWNLTSAGLIAAAGWVHGAADWWLFGGAIAVQVMTPIFARVDSGFVLNAAHFAERHGLMILIVLGESVLSVGFAAEEHHADLAVIVGTLAGLATAAAMWWMYFVGDDTRAAEAFETGTTRRRADQALLGYGLAHLVMIFGIVAVAAGTKLAIHDLMSPTAAWPAGLIAGGASVYLAGTALFRRVMGSDRPWPRLGTAALCVLTASIGTRSSTAAELFAVAFFMAVTQFVDRRLD